MGLEGQSWSLDIGITARGVVHSTVEVANSKLLPDGAVEIGDAAQIPCREALRVAKVAALIGRRSAVQVA